MSDEEEEMSAGSIVSEERGQREMPEASTSEAALLIYGGRYVKDVCNQLKGKVTQYNKELKEYPKVDTTLDGQDLADAYADRSEFCYQNHKNLTIDFEEVQNKIIKTIESINKIPGNTVVGGQAANQVKEWETALNTQETSVRNCLKNYKKEYETAKESTVKLGFRIPHESLTKTGIERNEERVKELGEKLAEQGKTSVKKKVGSAILSNKTIVLEDFDGEPENWSAFYDIFRPIVEENSELLDVVKFALLKKHCKGKAADMIKVFTSADCFDEAIERLKRNYEDKDNRFTMLWDKLNELKPAKENVVSMRKTINEVAALVAALKKVSEIENMGLKVLIKRKFPRVIHEELSRALGCKTTEEILRKIEETINREERIGKDMDTTDRSNRVYFANERSRDSGDSRRDSRDNRSERRSRSREYRKTVNTRARSKSPRYHQQNRDRRSNERRRSTSRRGYHVTNKEKSREDRPRETPRNHYPYPNGHRRQCLFCKGNHFSSKCWKVKSIGERKEFFRDKALCFKCAKKDHSVRECTGPACYKCGGSHYSALCPQLNRTYSGDRRSVSRDPSRERNRSYSQERGRSRSYDRGRYERDRSRSNDRNGYERGRFSSTDRSRDSSRERDRSYSRERNRQNDRNRRQYSTDRSRDSSGERYVSNNRSYNRNNRYYSRVNMVKVNDTKLMTVTGRLTASSESSRNHKKREVETLVILDTGADQNYIEEKIAEAVGAKIIDKNSKITIATVGGEEKEIRSAKVEVKLVTETGNIRIEAMTIPNITTEFVGTKIDPEEKEFLRKHRIPYRDPRNKGAGLLLGIDTFWLVMNNSDYIKLPTGRTLVDTKLGHVICGSGDNSSRYSDRKGLVVRKSKQKDLSKEESSGKDIIQSLEDVFTLQNIGITENPVDPKVEEIKQMFYDTVVKEEDGRVSVTYPFKKGMITKLADNYRMALARLRAMHRNSKGTDSWKKLVANFEDMISRKIIEDTNPRAVDEENRPVYYIPYQLVFNDNSNTTKVRVVYDASSAVRGEISLNQAIHQGPSMIPELLGIVIRVRTKRFILSGDIEKAFHMVGLQDIHRDCTRFLWLKNPEGEVVEENLRFMRFTRIPFGVNASPYLLAMAIEYAIENSDASEKLKEVVHRMCYVDNLFGTSNDDKELIELYKESKVVFSNTGMNIREFSLNSPLEEQIDKKDRTGVGQNTKLLGYNFDGKTDMMTVKKVKVKLSPEKPLTKRDVVSVVSGTYDPLQIFAPLYLEGKKLIREVSGKNVQWTSEVSREVKKRLEEYMTKIANSDLSFARFLEIPENSEITLAIFSDASKEVYGACAYVAWREGRQKELKASLVLAKQRLAQKGHNITIPRLELVGIVLAVRMANYLVKELDITITTIGIYSDSEIALSQIKSFKKDSVFIENRRNEIRRTIEELRYDEKNKRFREVFLTHVATKDNTADIITRGIESIEHDSVGIL